jgi:hypothetical protein
MAAVPNNHRTRSGFRFTTKRSPTQTITVQRAQLQRTQQNPSIFEHLRMLARLKFENWWTERATAAQLGVLDHKSKLAEAKALAFQRQLELTTTHVNEQTKVTDAQLQSLRANEEIRLNRRLAQASDVEVRTVLAREVMSSWLLAERQILVDHLRKGTIPTDFLPTGALRRRSAPQFTPALEPTAPSPPVPEDPPTESMDIFEIYLSEQQIEKLALKAVTSFAKLDREAVAAAWQTWESKLQQKFAPFIVAEIVTRAGELRAILGEKK